MKSKQPTAQDCPDTVLIMRDERYQPHGVWVFVNDLHAVRKRFLDYGDFGTSEEDIAEFIDALEEVPMIDAVVELLANQKDCYLHDVPREWADDVEG